MKNEHLIEDPVIRKLVEKLKDMPKRLARQKREYYERKEFVKKVFEKAVEQAFGPKIGS